MQLERHMSSKPPNECTQLGNEHHVAFHRRLDTAMSKRSTTA